MVTMQERESERERAKGKGIEAEVYTDKERAHSSIRTGDPASTSLRYFQRNCIRLHAPGFFNEKHKTIRPGPA